jgi:hypothetical protein
VQSLIVERLVVGLLRVDSPHREPTDDGHPHLKERAQMHVKADKWLNKIW